MTESVNTVDSLVQQLGYDAMSRLRQGLERAYSTVRGPYPEASTSVSAVVATSVCWKGEGSWDDGESKPAEGLPTETWHGSAKATRTRRSGKDRSFRR